MFWFNKTDFIRCVFSYLMKDVHTFFYYSHSFYCSTFLLKYTVDISPKPFATIQISNRISHTLHSYLVIHLFPSNEDFLLHSTTFWWRDQSGEFSSLAWRNCSALHYVEYNSRSNTPQNKAKLNLLILVDVQTIRGKRKPTQKSLELFEGPLYLPNWIIYAFGQPVPIQNIIENKVN